MNLVGSGRVDPSALKFPVVQSTGNREKTVFLLRTGCYDRCLRFRFFSKLALIRSVEMESQVEGNRLFFSFAVEMAYRGGEGRLCRALGFYSEG